MKEEIIILGLSGHSRTEHASFEEAEEILLSDRVSQISVAETDADGVQITSHYYICPECEERIPAYRWCFEKREYHCPYSEEEIREFCSPQLSLLQKKEQLIFNAPESLQRKRYCPYCGTSLQADEKEDFVTLTEIPGKIEVSHSLSLKDLMRFTGTGPLEIGVGDELTECITFDFCRGCFSLSVRSTKKQHKTGQEANAGEISQEVKILFSVTDPDTELLMADSLCRIIDRERAVTDRITEYFAQYFEAGKFPFEKEEMNLRRFRMLTMFSGFNRNFYEGIPFDKGQWRIAPEFESFISEIHRMEEIPAYLRKKNFPRAKKLRKLIFEKQSFLFYVDEIIYLWNLSGNADRCMRLLEHGGGLLPGYLRMYPALKEFFSDYVERCGIGQLEQLLKIRFFHATRYGIYYAMAGEKRRERQKEAFTAEMTACFTEYELDPQYSPAALPLLWEISMGTEDEMPYREKGFLFRRLTSSAEYRCAGTELGNCLKEYMFRYSHVVGIIQKGTYVGAMQIESREGVRVVTQIKGPYNREIKEDSRPGKAVISFMKHYGLKNRASEDDVGDEDIYGWNY